MATRQTVLILDADPASRDHLAAHLAAGDDFTAATAETIREAEARIMAGDHEVGALILDTALPDGDGRALCARLRRRGVAMPILLLTSQAGEAEVVDGLNAGANDFIVKPFRSAELLARLRAQMRSFVGSDAATLTIGPYHFRPSAKHLQRSGSPERIRLTSKEVGILRCLHRAGTAGVARDLLLREIWDYKPALNTHTLESHIYRLRQKMEAEPTKPRLLLTRDGRYCLVPG